MHSKRMFHEVIFPRYGVPRIVISDEDHTSLIGHSGKLSQKLELITRLPLHITLRRAVKQKHRTSKSRISFRRQWIKCAEAGWVKDRRGWPEGGEWGPIKIPRGNSAYIPNQTPHISFLARSRPPSYRKVIGPQNRVRNGKHNGKNEIVQARVTSETTIILSPFQAFHWTPCGCARETTMAAQWEQGKLEPFDPVTREWNQLHLQVPRTTNSNKNQVLTPESNFGWRHWKPDRWTNTPATMRNEWRQHAARQENTEMRPSLEPT
jgi:hypothetical protein